MQRDLIIKGRGLGGTSDLTLLAPIKPGFIDALDSVTYKTRIKRVLDALHAARQSTHEYAPATFLSDAVERVGAIHSVRVVVFEPEDKVMLAVTFDGSWESYIRVLWEKVGSLLDLIFCSTVDYVTACDHSFEEWLAWAQRVQAETGFFYGPPDFTARDVLYHRRIEQMRQRGLDTEVNELRAVLPPVEAMVGVQMQPIAHPIPDDPPPVPVDARSPLRAMDEQARNGLLGLAGLYRLTDLFRPGTHDGDVLRISAISLLQDFVRLCAVLSKVKPEAMKAARVRFARQLDWIFPGGDLNVISVRPALPFETPDAALGQDVQGGILKAYDNVTHGLIVMLAFDDALAAHQLLQELHASVTRDRDVHDASGGRVLRNFAITVSGLRACGLGETELDLFPQDFRQGMAVRAGALGDMRNNHPRRWRLPRRFAGPAVPAAADVIELGTVHAVVQLRCCAAPGNAAVDYWDKDHPLQEELAGLHARAGIRVLAVQSLKRNFKQVGGAPVVAEHFGFVDGIGQPNLDNDKTDGQRVQLGEIILGHNNAEDPAHDPADPTVSEADKARLKWLGNGSFLVMRKYRQYVERMHEAVTAAAAELAASTGMPGTDAQELVYAKLMGRNRDGTPLLPSLPPETQNSFNYATDPQGRQCPLHAHVRRANPRPTDIAGTRPPRIMRRGMSYGPSVQEAAGESDRGLVFMAYNANLSEQFEVIQRWLTGGNSTGSSSGQSCPIVGVPENGYPRHFRFEYGDQAAPKVLNVALEKPGPSFEEPAVFTRLEWGVYLFTPSLSVIERLAQSCLGVAGARPAAPSCPWRPERGREMIAALQQLEATLGRQAAIEGWKTAIEDPDGIDRLDSAALWAAIRSDHGGVLRPPYGILVASRELLSEVFLDTQERYSVSGHMARMRQSIGEISLGMDAGPIYNSESAPINDTILGLDPDWTFNLVRKTAQDKIQAIIQAVRGPLVQLGASSYEVSFDTREVIDEVLAALCEEWFGIKGSPFFSRGSTDWQWKEGDPPIYPGQFTALSRYMFQPNPGPTPVELGQRYGKALSAAMLRFVQAQRALGMPPQKPGGGDADVAAAAFAQLKAGWSEEKVADTLIGVMRGFTPTIIGAVLNVVREWQREGTFWALRTQVLADPVTDLQSAMRLLHRPMADASLMRPMPQIGWRTVRKAHRLGQPGRHAVDVAVGEIIVTAMVSGTQQSLADGQPDGRLMFGGVREDAHKPTQAAALHPTHACPGYHNGIAAMLGTLSALLACPDNIRQGLAPLTFEVRGPAAAPSPAGSPAP